MYIEYTQEIENELKNLSFLLPTKVKRLIMVAEELLTVSDDMI